MTVGQLPERSRIVQAALLSAGLEPEIRVLPDSARTATLAAAALGREIGAIANSLVFMAAAGGTPHTILPLRYQDLVMITNGRQEPVGD